MTACSKVATCSLQSKLLSGHTYLLDLMATTVTVNTNSHFGAFGMHYSFYCHFLFNDCVWENIFGLVDVL